MCCVLIVSVGVTSVRIADRLINFLKPVGAFSHIIVDGLLYIQSRRFIKITLPLQSVGLSV